MKTSMKNVIITGIFSIVVGIISFISGENKVNQQIENKIEQSGITINNISNENNVNTLLNDYKELTNQLFELKEENISLSNEKEDVKKQYSELLNNYNILSKDYQNSIDSISKLQDEMNTLKLNNQNQYPLQLNDSYTATKENPSDFLYDLDYMALHTPQDNFYRKVSNLYDSTGNNHDNVILCRAYTTTDDMEDNSLYAEYYLNKKYTSLKGKIVIPEDTKNSDDVYVVYFYGDSNYITETDKITIGSLPYEFNVPVEDIVKLKIKIVRTERNLGNSSIAITEARFYNEIRGH